MKNLLYLTVTLLLISLHACEKKNNPGIYDNCCGTSPVADEVTLLIPADSNTTVGRIYIPNIFIPDTSASATQDFFFLVYGNDGVLQIELFRLTSETGEILYEAYNFPASLANAAWNGRKKDGSLYYGSFNYEAKVEFADGQKKTYTGKACSFQCGSGDFPAQKLPECFFPEQNDGEGRPAPTFPYLDECF